MNNIHILHNKSIEEISRTIFYKLQYEILISYFDFGSFILLMLDSY